MEEKELSISEQAYEKMLVEMNKPHDAFVDEIHNWLCQQSNDVELMTSIMKPTKTIHYAIQYLLSEAKKNAMKGTWMGLDNEPIFRIIREYFMDDAAKNQEGPKASVAIKNSKSSDSVSTGKSIDVEAIKRQAIVEFKRLEAEKKVKKEESSKLKERSDAASKGLMSMFDFGIDEALNVEDPFVDFPKIEETHEEEEVYAKDEDTEADD